MVISMSLLDLYQKKQNNEKVHLRHHDVDRYLKSDGDQIDVDSMLYLLLLSDVDTIDTVADKVGKIFSNLDEPKRAEVFKKLAGFVDKFEIRTVLNYLVESDFINYQFLFDSFIDSKTVKRIDKLILLEAILNVCKSANKTYFYGDKLLNYCKETLSDPYSSKPAVRLSVSLLRAMAQESDDNSKYLDAVTSLYENNENWKIFRNEEICYRHKILMSSFNDKVSEAFRNKQYKRVVNLIGKYENELPEILRKKLMFSRKHLDSTQE